MPGSTTTVRLERSVARCGFGSVPRCTASADQPTITSTRIRTSDAFGDTAAAIVVTMIGPLR